MLDERKLDQTVGQLASFGAASGQHHATLTEVVQQYTRLLGEYKRLKSDYKEERDSRELHKQMVKCQERNPFVLVLIDGDGYVFNDGLVNGGVEGGQKAARLLNDTVRNSLERHGLDHCKIIVRVYANVAGLSNALSRAGLVGSERRSLATFAAGFTRFDMFDYVDAGQQKEGADFKIRAMFRQFVDNIQCRHVYFAGCHDVGYVSELLPYVGQHDRITLVNGPGFHQEFTKLSMRIEDFPDVFRSQALDTQAVVPATTAPPAPKFQSFTYAGALLKRDNGPTTTRQLEKPPRCRRKSTWCKRRRSRCVRKQTLLQFCREHTRSRLRRFQSIITNIASMLISNHRRPKS